MKIIFSSFGEFDSQHAIGPAQWPHFDLLFVHRGNVRLSINDHAPRELGRNQAVLLYPHTPFQGESISDTSLASVHHFLPTG